MYLLTFNISHAMNRDIKKLSKDELDNAIELVSEVISNDKFKYDKKIFIDRLMLLKERKV